ncbi:MAG: transcriptional repressor [Bacteroidetes bacterium]|nr:MAG: transcriptional repressor [Bacteroidota bacterium]
MKPVKEIAKTISASGLKITPQRIAVIQALEKLEHPRAEDIIREVSEHIPGLSPTTVYNTLDVLVSKKIIRKVHTEADVMRYDAIPDHHHHLYCMQSDRMDDYFDPELDSLLEDYFRKKNIKGFKLKEIKLQLMGEFEIKERTTIQKSA